MDKLTKLEILRTTLRNTLGELNAEYLLRWLDSLPHDFHFRSVEDLVIALIGYDRDPNAYSDDEGWMFLQDIWKSIYEPEVRVDGGELVVESNHVEIVRIAIPDWILDLDGLISFLKEARGGRIPTAMELKELLVNLWFPEFC